MAITAFPVLARIITETKLLSTPIGGIALPSAAVDDVTYVKTYINSTLFFKN